MSSVRKTKGVAQARKTILVVEDDPAIRRNLKDSLGLEGYEVRAAATLAEGKSLFGEGGVDLVLLDLNLPDGTSFDLCRSIAEENPSLPVLILTAELDESSAVKGLSLGAVDYIRKPFGRRELLLRIRKCIGRKRGKCVLGDLVVDIDERVAKFAGKALGLTPTEFEILAILSAAAGGLVSRETILAAIDSEGESFGETLHSHLSRLRSKLKKAGANNLSIEASYGEGYRFVKVG